MNHQTPRIVVCALYKFVRLENFQAIREPLFQFMQTQQITGTLLLAHEGINGTVAGTREAIDALLNWLHQIPELAAFDYKESYTDTTPFKRCKVKLKKEIVTMGIEDIDPNHTVGTYLNAAEWNEVISDPETLLIDTRNDYEYQVGTFKGAINPKTDTFREFPDYIKANYDPNKHKKIAMFCTGGIRCEKSTAFMKENGFDEVYHLKGGILQYLEDMPQNNTLWEGECFVFDDRVTVDHDLNPGSYDQCHACRLPLSEADKNSSHYVKGVSCPHCHDKYTDEQRQRFAEREKQIQLAKQRGEQHIGGQLDQQIEKNRSKKIAFKEKQRLKNEVSK